MRCKLSRVLSVIREQLHHEPSGGEGSEIGYRIDWKDVVLLLDRPVAKIAKNKVVKFRIGMVVLRIICIFIFSERGYG